MKQKKIKVIAMVLSLFAACSGILSAMETSKSEENSKMNLKFDQNNNKTENNKPQSDSKSNQNIGIKIPYYAYPMGYLGLNEIGGLLGFNYLLFGKYGIIKGAKHLLYDEKVEDWKGEIKTKDEIEKGPYWQHNYNMIMNTNTFWNYPGDYFNVEFEQTLKKIMTWPNEKILLGQPYVGVRGNYIDLGNRVTGFSYEGFLKNLRGNQKIKWAERGVRNSFHFCFEGINDRKFELCFRGGFWNDYYTNNKPSITLEKSFGKSEANRVSMRFSAQPELYSW